MKYLGSSDNFALFSNGELATVIDTELEFMVEYGELSDIESRPWNPDVEVSESVTQLASASLESIESALIAAGNSRMYTIPGGVQAEAKKALKWRKEHKRGGTPVGLNTARTLAKGGQIGIKKIRHIAKYFPRHEVDKKGKGWDMGEDGFPSNGRIAWALWGGDAAKRWASAIVERENKKALAAGGYNMPGYDDHLDYYMPGEEYDSEIDAFREVHEMDETYGPEFMVRVCTDGSGIDRLYKVDIDGRVYVWDDCRWDDMGDVYGDVYSYDESLDDPYDYTPRTHIPVDPSSAVIISALMQERPFQNVLIDEIDADEAKMMAYAMAELDYGMIDRVITAAGEEAPATDQDGNYTPEERAAKASNQPRDASGKFAKAGNRVVVAGDVERGSGVITNVDSKTGMVTVKLDSGKEISVDAKYTRAEEEETAGPKRVPEISGRLDVSGILGEPRTPINMPKAHLPGTLPPMSTKELQLMLNDWPAWVKQHRASFKPVTAAADEKPMTPETTDVPAKYLAIVSPDDTQAVMDLVALVPASATSTEPAVYKREDGKWVPDEQILRDLKSATPPPVIKLDDKEILNDVLKQVDNIKSSTSVAASALHQHMISFWYDVAESIQAAGGLDRNRGNAEELRRYWTRGEGALKIRWGTPGDWTRCVRHLSKYMGPRAKGYCQLRHKEVTGVYTGSKYNVGKDNKRNIFSMFESEDQMTTAVIDKSLLAAQVAALKERVSPVTAGAHMHQGSKFYIPLLIPEDLESGDGRKFKKESINFRELPLPLLWQIKTGDGHNGSVVVGRIDHMERVDGGIGNAYGVFDSGPYGREAERLVKNGFIRGVSADLDQFEAKEHDSENAEKDDDEIGKKKITINHARVMAATIVAKPAFQECTISISNEYQDDQEDTMIPDDGIYEESFETFVNAEAITASGFLSSEIPMTPPRSWFDNPGLTKPTPITVDDNGRIYGHIAAWHVNHIGMPRSTRPPRSRSNYAYFQTGVLRTDDGSDVPVGQLTLAGGHAPLQADAAAAAKHYDDTASAIADVRAGEDEYGIWVAGSLRPTATEMQIRALRASAPSGDWRPINGSLELVAVCQVNVPGFPVARAMVASGKVMALVAAGASYLAIMRSDTASHFVGKAAMLAELSADTPDLRNRVKTAKKALKASALTAAAAKIEEIREKTLIAAAVAELAKFSEEERKELADKGMALPDGSYPIRNEDDLKNAIKAYGRSNPKDRAKVRAHIRKRAKALGKKDLIPDSWKAAASMDAESLVASMRSRIAEFAEGDEITPEELEELKKAKEEAEKQTEEEIQAAEDIRTGKTTATDKYDEKGRTKYTPKTQPRDAKGKYRKVLARLKQDLGVAGLSRALQKVEEAENLDFAGDYAASAKASSELLGMIDRIDTKALNPRALRNVQDTARELGRVIANLPLPFGKEASKIRFSDLPSGLKTLIEDMIDRVEAKIGKEDADIATANLRSYMSGADYYSQGEVQSEMSKLLRLLT